MRQQADIRRFEPLEQPPARPCSLGRILVVGDDGEAGSGLVGFLGDHHGVAIRCSAADAAAHVQRHLFSLVLLHVGEKGPSGTFDLLRLIRERSDVPVILIDGRRMKPLDRVVGLELGADDVLAKPFSPRELLARARAILRRQELGRLSTASPMRGGYRFEGWELRHRNRSLRDPAGEIVPLTKRDYALLVAFLDAPRRLLSRAQLIRATRAHEDIFDRSIDVQVLRLRRKLEDNPLHPHLIKTERGVGYIFDADVEILF
jgi:two-component system OmpR family response regulator